MKKYISFVWMAVALCLGFVSCDVETDEKPGGTNVQKMAGRWEVTLDIVGENGDVLAEDPFGFGVFEIQTYNTADNSPSLMWLDDLKNFWAFKFKVNVNYQARTFSAEETDYDAAGSGKAIVKNGKVLEGAAKNLHGMPNDSIVFDIAFSDDDEDGDRVADPYCYTYRLSGQRYTGFYE